MFGSSQFATQSGGGLRITEFLRTFFLKIDSWDFLNISD